MDDKCSLRVAVGGAFCASFYKQTKGYAGKEILMVTPDHIHTLVEHGKVLFPLTGFEADVGNAIDGLTTFFRRDRAELDRWTFDVAGEGDPDDGFIRRDGDAKPNGEHNDLKSVFHYRPRLFSFLRGRGVSFDAERSFLDSCDRVHQLCLSTFGAFVRRLNMESSDSFQLDFQESVLRLQVYDEKGPEENQQGDGAVICKAHTDRNFLTIHLAESFPGLRVGALRELYRVEPGQVLIFPGQKAGARTGGRLQPLIHDVVNLRVEERGRRWSVVFFGHVLPLKVS